MVLLLLCYNVLCNNFIMSVLSKMPFVDLSKMKVNLIRADGNKFCAIAGSKLEGVYVGVSTTLLL